MSYSIFQNHLEKTPESLYHNTMISSIQHKGGKFTFFISTILVIIIIIIISKSPKGTTPLANPNQKSTQNEFVNLKSPIKATVLDLDSNTKFIFPEGSLPPGSKAIGIPMSGACSLNTEPDEITYKNSGVNSSLKLLRSIKPFYIQINYEEFKQEGRIDEDSLAIYACIDNQKNPNKLSSSIDRKNSIITASTDRFGYYGLLAKLTCGDKNDLLNDGPYPSCKKDLVFGQRMNGVFDIKKDIDWYCGFTPTNGKKYTITLDDAAVGVNPIIELKYKSSDTIIQLDKSQNQAQVSWVANIRQFDDAPSPSPFVTLKAYPQKDSKTGCDAHYSFSVTEE